VIHELGEQLKPLLNLELETIEYRGTMAVTSFSTIRRQSYPLPHQVCMS